MARALALPSNNSSVNVPNGFRDLVDVSDRRHHLERWLPERYEMGIALIVGGLIAVVLSRFAPGGVE